MSKFNEWFVVTIEKTSTQHHNGHIYTITLMNLAGETAITYVDPTFRNYKNWQHIIAGDRADRGFMLNNLNYKGDGMIDADSKPVIAHEHQDKTDMLDIINDELEFDPRRAIFNRLFDL